MARRPGQLQHSEQPSLSARGRFRAGAGKGTKITNDAVSQEAGRGKGSIKRSRAVFGDLILAIDEAAAELAVGKNKQKAQLDKAKSSAEQCRADPEAALAREFSLLDKVYRLRKQLARLRTH